MAEVNQAENLFQAVKCYGPHSGVTCKDSGSLSCHTLLSVIRRTHACHKIPLAQGFMCYSAGWHGTHTVATVPIIVILHPIWHLCFHSAFFTHSPFSSWAMILNSGQLQKQHLPNFCFNSFPNLRIWCLWFLYPFSGQIYTLSLGSMINSEKLTLDLEKKKMAHNSNF